MRSEEVNGSLRSTVFLPACDSRSYEPSLNLAGLPNIPGRVAEAVPSIDMQYLLSSTGIDIVDDGEVGIANATMYFQVSLFGRDDLTGNM